jgi:hypothetical protein
MNQTLSRGPSFPTLHCEIRASKRLGPILGNILKTCARHGVTSPGGTINYVVIHSSRHACQCRLHLLEA